MTSIGIRADKPPYFGECDEGCNQKAKFIVHSIMAPGRSTRLCPACLERLGDEIRNRLEETGWKSRKSAE